MKKQLKEETFLDKWLTDCHGTTLEKVLEKHVEWQENPSDHTRDFYETYAVTQEQHDAWYDWAISYIVKDLRVSKKFAIRSFAISSLNVAPQIKHT